MKKVTAGNHKAKDPNLDESLYLTKGQAAILIDLQQDLKKAYTRAVRRMNQYARRGGTGCYGRFGCGAIMTARRPPQREQSPGEPSEALWCPQCDSYQLPLDKLLAEQVRGS